MVRNTHQEVQYAPLYVHCFHLVQPHHILEAEKFNIHYSEPDQITNIAVKLRWYRHQKGMLQREVADYIGVNRATYVHYEDGTQELYPAEVMMKLTELYGVSADALLDEYNWFIWRGQGRQVQELRLSKELTILQFAEELNVYPTSIRRWEDESQLMTKSTWERYFKDSVPPARSGLSDDV